LDGEPGEILASGLWTKTVATLALPRELTKSVKEGVVDEARASGWQTKPAVSVSEILGAGGVAGREGVLGCSRDGGGRTDKRSGRESEPESFSALEIAQNCDGSNAGNKDLFEQGGDTCNKSWGLRISGCILIFVNVAMAILDYNLSLIAFILEWQGLVRRGTSGGRGEIPPCDVGEDLLENPAFAEMIKDWRLIAGVDLFSE
jgi:hypothetical protein